MLVARHDDDDDVCLIMKKGIKVTFSLYLKEINELEQGYRKVFKKV